MNEYLLDYRPFVNEAYDLHLPGTLGAGERVNLPNFLYSFAPYQLRYLLGLIIPDLNYFALFQRLKISTGKISTGNSKLQPVMICEDVT